MILTAAILLSVLAHAKHGETCLVPCLEPDGDPDAPPFASGEPGFPSGVFEMQGLEAPYAVREASAPVDDSVYAGHRPTHAFELAYSFESVWAAYRGRFGEGRGYVTVGFLGNEDDDGAFLVRVMRFGEPQDSLPLGLGVGLGLYGGFIDEPDADFYALALAGYMDYAFDTPWPLRLTGEVSFAPDIATTSEADELLDVLGRLEVELSEFAGAYIGARLFEVALEGGSDRELDSSVHVGIRLWL